MKKKLLNIFKNLIIITILVIIGIAMSSTSVFAESATTLPEMMREKVASWFVIVQRFAITAMAVALLIWALKYLLSTKTPDSRALFKSLIVDWILAIAILVLLPTIMYAVIYINAGVIKFAKKLGAKLSGLSADAEYDLYEAVLSKAYEFNAVSGMLGLIMYIMLVFYTYKFVFIYAKRYINVIVLMIISPIVCALHSFRKIISGKSTDLLRKWFKEYVFNIMLQGLHAIFYASCVGLTLKFLESPETYVGAVLTLFVFGFIFKIDGIIRKLFNAIGGKTSVQEKTIFDRYDSAKASLGNLKNSVQNFGKDLSKNSKNLTGNVSKHFTGYNMGKFKNDVAATQVGLKTFAGNAVNTFDKKSDVLFEASKVKVSQEEVDSANEFLHSTKLGQTMLNTNKVIYDTGGKLIDKTIETTDKIKKALKDDFADEKKLAEITAEISKKMKKLVSKYGTKTAKKTWQLFTDKNARDAEIQKICNKSMNFAKNGKEILENMVDYMSKGKDALDALYLSAGPQVFLSPEFGIPSLGLVILANAGKNAGKAIINFPNKDITITSKRLRKLTAPTIPNIYGESEEKTEFKEGQKIKLKKYVFKRFNAAATRRIVDSLQRHTVMRDSYLRTRLEISQSVAKGQLRAIGAMARISSMAHAPAGTAYKLKHNANTAMAAYAKRASDGKWVVLGSQIADISTKNVTPNYYAIAQRQKRNLGQAALNSLEKMGNAISLSPNMALIIGDATKGLMMAFSPFVTVGNSLYKTIYNKVDVVDSMINNVSVKSREIFHFSNFSIVNLVSKQMINEHPNVDALQDVGIVSQDKIVQFVINSKGKTVKQVVDLDGNVTTVATNKKGNLIQETNTNVDITNQGVVQNEDGEIIQRVVGMDGTVLEQRLYVTDDGKLVIDTEQGFDKIKDKDLTSYDTKSVVESIRKDAFNIVNQNLKSVGATVKNAGKITDFTQIYNSVGYTEDELTTAEMKKLDKMMRELAPAKSKEEQAQLIDYAVIDRGIVDAAIQSEVYTISQLDLTNPENTVAREKVINSLIDNGLIDKSIKDDSEKVDELMDSLQERVHMMAESESEIVLEVLAGKEYAGIVQAQMIKKTLNQDTHRDIDTSMNTLSKVIQKAARETVEQREREKYGVALGKDDATQYVRNVKLTFYGDIVRERINSKTKQKEKVDKVDIFVKEGISLRQAIQRAQISKNAASYEIIESYFIKNYNGTIERIGTTGEIKVTYDMYGTEIYIPNKSEDTSSGEKTIYDNKPGAVAKFEDLIRANRSTINMTLNKFMEEKEEVTSLIDIATKPPIQRAFLLKLKKDLRRTELASDENEQDLLYFVSTIHKPNENPIYNTLNTSVKDQLERRLNEKAAKLANEKIEMVHKSSRIIETDDLAANTSVADEIAKREVQRIEAQNRANQEDEKNRIIEELLTDMRERALIEAGSSNNQEQKKHKEMPLD